MTGNHQLIDGSCVDSTGGGTWDLTTSMTGSENLEPETRYFEEL